MEPKRVIAAGVTVLSGVGVIMPNALHLLTNDTTLLGTFLGFFGVVLGITLAIAGIVLYRSHEFVSTPHTLRVAGWNLLGVVVLGAVLGLAVAYVGSFPTFVAATIIGVSAVAHVLIGIADVRRIRAEALARQRERLAVLNRLVRHDLRHEAQVLIGLVSDVRTTGEGETPAREVHDVADRLSGMHEDLGTMQQLMEDRPNVESIALTPVVEHVADRYRDAHPDADVSTSVGDVRILAIDELEIALDELVDNAIEHNPADRPKVWIDATETDGTVTIEVRDDGPGIPERERAVVSGKRAVEQIDHATGLGLWTVRTIVETVDGALEFGVDDEGSVVRMEIPRAP